MANVLKIREDLWDCIKVKYDDEHYTNVILDSINFLGAVIREKADSTLDGKDLAQTVFSPNNPKIQLNNLATQTDKSIQKGMMDSVSGLYQLIRNPRSHGIIQDTKQDAVALVKYIDFLLRQIETAKTEFTVEQFGLRIFDRNFVDTKRYAELLAAEIPKNKVFDTILYLTEKLDDAFSYYKYKNLFNILVDSLSEGELSDLYSIISKEFSVTDSLLYIAIIAHNLPVDNWKMIDELSRIRVEDMLLNIATNSDYGDEYDLDYQFVASVMPILKYFHNESQFKNLFLKYLSGGYYAETSFVVTHFWDYLSGLNQNEKLHRPFVTAVKKALAVRSTTIYSKLIEEVDEKFKNEWYVVFNVAIEQFKKDNRVNNLNDLNGFQVIDGDDDIPF